MNKPKHILFMCVANSARSQLAEGLARDILGNQVHVESAGSNPGKLNPFAVQVMKEIGIDISKQYSKSIQDLPAAFLDELDYVITLCAEEVCPVVITRHAKKLHWPLQDPVGAPEESRLAAFRLACDEIKDLLIDFKQKI